MNDRVTAFDRRTALRTLLASVAIGLAGCSDLGGSTKSNPITRVAVSKTSLVVEFEAGRSIDQISVVQPDGESFATRSVTQGSTRETVEIGTQYPPGKYTVHALSGEETVGERTLSIKPDVRITDLKLGRNHPEQMYEGAGNSATRSEVIVTVENRGTGPDVVRQLRFEGDIPQPSEKESQQSGIYDTTSNVGGEAKKVVVPSQASKTIYSTSRPFTSASSNVSCTPNGEQGKFTAIVRPQIDETTRNKYSVEYTGEDLGNCNITVSKVNDE